jgi:hypothetical protein
MRPQLRFSRRKSVFVVLIACVFFGAALCLRYLLIENPKTTETCQGGAAGLRCEFARTLISLFQYSVFGWVATIAAALNLVRPSLWIFSIAAAATSFGLVLYNAGLAAFAVALLLLSLARVSPGAASMPGQ